MSRIRPAASVLLLTAALCALGTGLASPAPAASPDAAPAVTAPVQATAQPPASDGTDDMYWD